MSPLRKKIRGAIAAFIVAAIALTTSLPVVRAQEGSETPVPPAIGSGATGAVSGKYEQAKPSQYPTNSGRSVRPDTNARMGDPTVGTQAPPISAVVERTLDFNSRLYPPTGAFNGAFMMTYDTANNELYISDYNNNRVLMYNSNNVFIRQVGSSANYNGPGGIVVDVPNNHVYVADCGGGNIDRFDRFTGAYQTSIGSGLGCPTGMAYNPIDGFLYTVETSNNRVHKYALNGTDQGTIGGSGTGNGQFSTPYGIAIDQTYGYIYVADSGNNRIQKFYTGGAFARVFGTSGAGAGFTNYPLGLAIDRAGILYVADVNNFRVQKFDNLGTYRGQYQAQGGTCLGIFQTTCNGYISSLRGVAVSATGDVYTSDAGSQTVQRYNPAAHPTGRFNAQAINSGFNSIGGTAVDSEENVYATDVNNHRIQKFNKFGQLITTWGSFGTGNGFFNQPLGIAIDSSDTIYVADSSNHRIQKFTKTGGYAGQFGSFGTANTQFKFPSGVAVDADGFVYITEEGNHRVKKTDSVGNPSRVWGTLGSGAGQLNTPTGIAVDEKRGFVWVAEFGNNRLQLFTIYGDVLGVVPASTSGACALLQPIGVATDQRGNVLVADRGHNQLVMLNENGRCIGIVASPDVQGVSISRKSGQTYTGGGSNDNLLRRVGAPSARTDTIGVYRPSTQTFLLRNSNSGGAPDITATVNGATANDLPVVGDWNNDGLDSIGLYRSTTGFFYLWDRNVNQNMGLYNYLVLLGNPGDQPIAGDWDADGRDGVGTFRPSNGILYLRNALTSGVSDYAMVLGNPSDSGVAGDWDGDGSFSAGIYRPSENRFYLTDRNTNGIVFGDYTATLGASGDVPFAGDWISQGSSGVGVLRPSAGVIYLKNGFAGTLPDASIVFGGMGDIPVAGVWGTPPALPDEPIATPPRQYSQPPILFGNNSGGGGGVNPTDGDSAD